jgi:hypothetical protein
MYATMTWRISGALPWIASKVHYVTASIAWRPIQPTFALAHISHISDESYEMHLGISEKLEAQE